jgi:predicted DNA-binding protein
MINPQFRFRLPPEAHESLRKVAAKSRQTPSDFVRDLVLASIASSVELPQTSDVAKLVNYGKTEEIIERLVALEESIQESRTLSNALADRIEVVAMAAVASSAMLRESGALSDAGATQAIVTHIQDALTAAPGIIRHRKNAAANG